MEMSDKSTGVIGIIGFSLSSLFDFFTSPEWEGINGFIQAIIAIFTLIIITPRAIKRLKSWFIKENKNEHK